MRVLVVNLGSSSLKLSLLDEGGTVITARSLMVRRGRVDPSDLALALAGGLGDADAVAHRIVHGGAHLHGPVRLDEVVEGELRSLADQSPLHQLPALDLVSAVRDLLPAVPAYGCFDTGFHDTIPEAASTYALPREWRETWTLRRFGFHGLSHAAIARYCGVGRVVSCHLGAGASLCAILDGESIDTTMGFTPLEGLVMATRSGSVDPGLVLWLLEHTGLDAAELEARLEHDSGLRGLAGTADMRAVLAGAAAGDARCLLAREVYLHRFTASIGAMTVALGGLDTLVFTGGVGEHSADIRSMVGERLAFLGVQIDADRNAACFGDADLSAASSVVRVLVRTAREDAEIARQMTVTVGR